MKDATQAIFSTLTGRGYRVTAARANIITVLATSSEPLTIQALSQQVKANEASVYRTIAVLQKESLIEEISIRGQAKQFAIQNHHHHHAVCHECGIVVHVACEQKLPTPKLQQFPVIDDHEVTFYGLCAQCA